MRELLKQADLEYQQREVTKIGHFNLSPEEEALFKRSPDTAINPVIDDFKFQSNQEKINVKARYEIKGWLELTSTTNMDWRITSMLTWKTVRRSEG